MKCTHCGAEMMLRQEHCPSCGQKAVFDFDVLAQSVHEDAARRRGEQIEGWLKWVVLLLMIVGAAVYGLNNLYDQPLAFDGGAVPALQVEEVVPVTGITPALAPYTDPRPSPPLPEPTMRVFGYRKDPVKAKLRAQNGGNKREGFQKGTVPAIQDGLRMLGQMQRSDGSWMVETVPSDKFDPWETKNFQWLRVGVSSLAILAFLGEGESWLTDEKSGTRSLHADRVKNGVAWLMTQQDAETGRFGPNADNTDRSMYNHMLYNHGLATLAMSEAAGISGDKTVRASAQKGIDFILRTQAPEGGWNFQGNAQGDSETPLSAWNVQALYAAREAGLKVSEDAFNRALEFYRRSTLIEKDGPRVSWSIKNDDRVGRLSLLGVTLMMRQMLGEDPRAKDLQLVASKLQDNPINVVKEWGVGWSERMARNDNDARAKYDPFHIYFTTYGMFIRGGKDWATWSEVMRKAVTEMQDSDGCWRCNDVFTRQAGFAYSTALSILTLQVYYRLQ
ncbi:MAG TPA: hypothetical protein VEK08_23825 [Planctomycetota bacterium]|nr:hypothetical protein [Planctomycetota bacterium]